MSELIAIAFPSEDDAMKVRDRLVALQREHLVDLEDAAVVVKDSDGHVKLQQIHNLTVAGAASGGFWGLLLGLLFLAPGLGVAVGAATGALAGALADVGVDDGFMKELGSTLAPGSSALFLLVRKATPDKVVAEIEPFGGRVLRTSLSVVDEERLRTALEGHGLSGHHLTPS